MDFSKTYTLESKTFPGVIVTLARMGPRMRANIELSLTEPRARERELSMKRDFCDEKLRAILGQSPLDEDGKVIEAALPAEALEAADELIAVRAQLSNTQRALIYPVFVKAAVKGFNSELTYDGGQPATAELLCEHGPDELFLEIVKAVNGNGYLSTEQVENLSLPTTSVAQVDGETNNTNATPASSAPDSQLSAAA